MYVPFDKLKDELIRILLSLKFTHDKAELLAKTFAESSRDGVYTHGLEPFPIICAIYKRVAWLTRMRCRVQVT